MSPRRRYAASPADEAEGLSPAAPTIRVGTAGWAIPGHNAAEFVGEGSHLERYARRFSAVEINSSFHRPHRPSSYARWALSVPPTFRFAVKLPREITHTRKLADPVGPLERFLGEVEALEGRLGPILVQLPPSLQFESAAAAEFLEAVRARFAGDVVCEPRHASWFADPADAMLARFRVARVAADPAPVPVAAAPGGWAGLVYRRLHGTPTIYQSEYTPGFLDETARAMLGAAEQVRETWCVFDNTARGAAAGNALALLGRLEQSPD